MAQAVAVQDATDTQTNRVERWLNRLVGRSEPAPAPPLAARTVGSIILILAIWRSAILAFSMLLDRLGQAQCGQGIPAPWKYSACWDTQAYQIIASHGYEYTPGAPSYIAYFPLYPLLMRVADRIIYGPGDVLAGLVVGHLALLTACIYILQLVRIDFGERVAWRTLIFLLVFPSAFFFSAAYPEPLFLLGLAGSLYHARRGQWLRAGLFGVIASATKLIGAFLIVPLAVELLAQHRDSVRRPRALAGLALAPMGLVAYFGYLQVRFGDFRVFFDAQRNWDRESMQPVFHLGIEWLLGAKGLAEKFYPAPMTPVPGGFLLVDTTLLLTFVVFGVVLWWRVRPSYGALVLGMSLIMGMSGQPQSMNRYLVVLFPAFILLGRIPSALIRTALIVAFSAGLGLETYFFVSAQWAG